MIAELLIGLQLVVGPTDLEVMECPVPDEDLGAITNSFILQPDVNPGGGNPGCADPQWNDVCWAACPDAPTCDGCCEVQFRNAIDGCWTQSCRQNAVTRVVRCKNSCVQAEATGLYD